jgi:hypothetical protein
MENHMIPALTIKNGRSPSCEAIPGTDGGYLQQALTAAMIALLPGEVCHLVIHVGCLLQETSKATPGQAYPFLITRTPSAQVRLRKALALPNLRFQHSTIHPTSSDHAIYPSVGNHSLAPAHLFSYV